MPKAEPTEEEHQVETDLTKLVQLSNYTIKKQTITKMGRLVPRVAITLSKMSGFQQKMRHAKKQDSVIHT